MRHPETGIHSEETVDFRLDLNTPVNWREGQTESSGFSPCGFRVCQRGFEPEYKRFSPFGRLSSQWNEHVAIWLPVVDTFRTLNTPVNWREGQTESSGFSPCVIRLGRRGSESKDNLSIPFGVLGSQRTENVAIRR